MPEPSNRRWPTLWLLLPVLLGCDVVQGFQDAGNTLFPEQSTHLSTPALRLVNGGYKSLDLAAGKELSVLARSTESDTSLFVMRFANPKPCEIPDVGRYVASRNPNRAEAGIAYFHEDVAQGTLRFADTSCRTFDLALDNALLPIGETEHGVVVWADGQLLKVDPEKGERATLAQDVTNLVTRAFSGRTLVVTGGRIEVFDSEWHSQGTFGDGVTSIGKTNGGALYQDSTGLRRLSAGPDNTSTQDALIVPDVCSLAMRGNTWATFYAPCGEGRLRALREATGELYDLPFDADPQNLRLIPARGSSGNSPVDDPFWFMFLRQGALVVRDPEGSEHVIGENATLSYSDLTDADDAPYGHAVINIADGTGDYVYFDTQGERRTLARGAYTRADRLLVDWDGTSGNLAAVSGARLAIVAERVPHAPVEFTDDSGEWTVLFHDWQGKTGRLSRMAGTLDALANTPIDAPFAAPPLEEVGSEVGIGTTARFSALIPGTIFLSKYDTTTGTGRLSYENAELRFKATVDNGVSSYLFTQDYLLYTIPRGSDQGIWLATGK